MQALKGLEGTQGFKVYCKALEAVANIYAHTLVHGNLEEYETVKFRGIVKGLLDAADLVTNVVTRTEEHQAYVERTEREHKHSNALYWGNSLFYGSPWSSPGN